MVRRRPADLAAYKPEWQEPAHTTCRGYDVYSNARTSRGGIELTMQLNLLEGFDVAKMGPNSPDVLHLEIEAIKVVKADVYRYVANPRFTKVPVAGLLSKSYADSRRALIQPSHAMVYPSAGEPGRFTPSTAGVVAMLQRPPAGPAFPDDYETERDTTSFSIVDQYGNAGACTPTLGGGFGNGVVVGHTGLLLNNGLRLGSTSPYPDNVMRRISRSLWMLCVILLGALGLEAQSLEACCSPETSFLARSFNFLLGWACPKNCAKSPNRLVLETDRRSARYFSRKNADFSAHLTNCADFSTLLPEFRHIVLGFFVDLSTAIDLLHARQLAAAKSPLHRCSQNRRRACD